MIACSAGPKEVARLDPEREALAVLCRLSSEHAEHELDPVLLLPAQHELLQDI